jgi:hypothetical protein
MRLFFSSVVQLLLLFSVMLLVMWRNLNNIVTFCKTEWKMSFMLQFHSVQYILNGNHKIGQEESGEMSYWLTITVISFLFKYRKQWRKFRWCFSLFLPVGTINLWGQWIPFLLLLFALYDHLYVVIVILYWLFCEFLHCFDWERVVNWILLTINDQILYWLWWKYSHMINSFTYSKRYRY